MKICGRFSSFVFLMVVSGCSHSDSNPSISVSSFSFDFTQNLDGWVADFTDLPSSVEDSSFYELTFAYTNLPNNLGSHKSFMLSGFNHSDDLFMFIKKKVSGLKPNTFYNLVFEVELASNAPLGAAGVGGSPGASVYLKAGASEIEPKKIVQSSQYILNIDKGNQSTSGENVIKLGDIAKQSSSPEYEIITRSNASSYEPFVAKSDQNGEIWLIIGTDSGFEGTTTVYYTKVNVVFSASN